MMSTKPTLNQRIFKDNMSTCRDPRTLLSVIASFVPEEHSLARILHSHMDSMEFAAPEMQPQFMRLMLSDITEALVQECGGEEAYTNAHESISKAPQWIRVIAVIISGGSKHGEELARTFR